MKQLITQLRALLREVELQTSLAAKRTAFNEAKTILVCNAPRILDYIEKLDAVTVEAKKHEKRLPHNLPSALAALEKV